MAAHWKHLLAATGLVGLLATGGAAAARRLESALAGAGFPRVHETPYLNEFAVRIADAAAVHERLLERLAVWHGRVGAGDPLDRAVEAVECLVGDDGRDF